MIVFLCGPYRAPTKGGIAANIRRARQTSIRLWKQGYTVICPHMNTAHLDGVCPDEVWLNGDIEIMVRCDAVYMMDGWQQSIGASNEHAIAIANGIDVMYEVHND